MMTKPFRFAGSCLLAGTVMMSMVGCSSGADDTQQGSANAITLLPSGIPEGVYDGTTATVRITGNQFNQTLSIDIFSMKDPTTIMGKAPLEISHIVCAGATKLVDVHAHGVEGNQTPILPGVDRSLALKDPGRCQLSFYKDGDNSIAMDGQVDGQNFGQTGMQRRPANALKNTYTDGKTKLVIENSDDQGEFTFSLTDAHGATLASSVAARYQDNGGETLAADLPGGCRLGLRARVPFRQDNGWVTQSVELSTLDGSHCPALPSTLPSPLTIPPTG
jgi:hypothetical protein